MVGTDAEHYLSLTANKIEWQNERSSTRFRVELVTVQQHVKPFIPIFSKTTKQVASQLNG